MGSSPLRCAMAYSDTPKEKAPQTASPEERASRSCSRGKGSGVPAASTTPITITTRREATDGARLSPKRAAMTAESAPSVARIGATTPTLPQRNA